MLLGNRTVFHKLPVRFLAGSSTSFHSQGRSGFGQAGMRRNRFLQDGATVALTTYSYPQGTYAPSGDQRVGSAYILPQRAGSIASFYEARVNIDPTARAVGGITTTGTATMVLDFTPAFGQLISSGNGTAGFSITAANLLLTASIGGAGSASWSITPNAPLLGAKADGIGSASMTFSGSLLPYAIGSMSGSTASGGVLSEASIIAAMNASPPRVNIAKVNDITVTGTGAPGNAWGP